MKKALVIIPTYDNQDTLHESLESLRQQQHEHFEAVVVGDGAPHRTAEIMAEICALDPRIRFESHPKSERTGEPHRDRIIRASNADFVAYLSDDDLWFPDHLSRLCAALEQRDWINTLRLEVMPEGAINAFLFNLGCDDLREAMQYRRINAFGLSNAGHRRAAYLDLASGWTTTPAGIPTDQYMWSKLAGDSRLSAGSLMLPTAIHFGAASRRRFGPAERRRELAHWRRQLDGRTFRRDLMAKASVMEYAVRLLQLGETTFRHPQDLLQHYGMLLDPQMHVTLDGSELPLATVRLNPVQLDSIGLALKVHNAPRIDMTTVRDAYQLSSRAPHDLALRLEAARLLMSRRLWSRAVELLSPVYHRDRVHPAVAERLALSLVHSGRLRRAQTVLESVLPDQPDNPWLRVTACQAALGLGHLDEMDAHLTELERIDPEHPQLMLLKAHRRAALSRDRGAAAGVFVRSRPAE